MRQENFFQSGRLKLSWSEWGSGNSDVIILLHGPRDCALSWEKVAETMAKDYRVIALDNRGHGLSENAGPSEYLFKDYVGDLGNLIRVVNATNIMIVGHSVGGLYAIDYLTQRGKDITKFIALDVVLSWDDSAEKYRPANIEINCKFDSESVMLRDPISLWDSWKNIEIPTLLVRGRQSEVLTHEMAVTMRECLPGCYLTELEGGGHWFHQESPNEFCSVLNWFLDLDI